MPYNKLSDLPDSVRNNLPGHGQEIYIETFNSAWETYDEPQERREGADREKTAHKVAWSAAKNKYRKKTAGGLRRTVNSLSKYVYT